VARHSRDGEGESEHFHEALSVSLSLDSSPRGRAFLLVKPEFILIKYSPGQRFMKASNSFEKRTEFLS
jgi:hypothetical protein